MFAVWCYVCNIGIKGCFRRFVGFLYIGWYNLSFWQTKCLKTAKNRFFKIGGQSMLWVLVCDMYPELRNRVQVMVVVCVFVLFPRPWIMCVGRFNSVEIDGNEFHYVFSKTIFTLFVVFIIFYKYGLWVFLGCQACFMCSGGVLYWLWRDMCL